MDITIEKENGVSVFAVCGRLDTLNYNDFDSSISKIIDNGDTNILLDCSKLEYISSSGLRVFVKTLKTLNEKGGKLAICGFNDSIKDIFKVTSFIDLFNIFSVKSDALKSFK